MQDTISPDSAEALAAAIEAAVTKVQDEPTPCIQAEGTLQVDGLTIYKMENFGIKLLPVA